MGFDMYLGETFECIEHHEQFLFGIAGQNPDAYPQLCWLAGQYYGPDPVLTPDMSNALVHEIIALVDEARQERKSSLTTIVRLLQFFSAAARSGQEIRCEAD